MSKLDHQTRARIAYKIFRNAKNRIRRLDKLHLLQELVKLLNRPDANSVERIKYYEPWHLLLLVKWTLLYGRNDGYPPLKPADIYEISYIMNLVKDLSKYVFEFRNMSDVYLQLRRMSFQQFWLQRGESRRFGIVRQYLLFADLEADHSFQEQFLDITGVSITDFIELSVVLYVRVIGESADYVTEEYFAGVREQYGTGTVQTFLNTLSITVADAKVWLASYDADKPNKYRSVEYEYSEPSPFLRFPLIKHGSRYNFISGLLLLESLSTYVYDTLRFHDADEFMTRFGRLFERLIGQALQSTGLTVYSEDEYRRHVGDEPNSKLVDFIVKDDECNVLVEAKGVVLNWEGMVTVQRGTVRRQSKSSILKAIEQAYSVIDQFLTSEDIPSVVAKDNPNYLLIVTFKDFFVRSGQVFRDYIAPDEVDRIMSSCSSTELLPLSNIFILSIDELDLVLSNVASGTRTLNYYLETAARKNATGQPMASLRNLAIQDVKDSEVIPTIKDATDDLFDRLAQRLT